MHGLGSSGQQLQGGWSGYYLEGNVSFLKIEFYITINKISDTAIEGYSTTIIKNDTSVCILKGGFLKKKKIYLEETSIIKNFDKIKNPCLQRFELFYRENKKDITLNGGYTTKTCGMGGTVFLIKTL